MDTDELVAWLREADVKIVVAVLITDAALVVLGAAVLMLAGTPAWLAVLTTVVCVAMAMGMGALYSWMVAR